jgi:hypothetical protein
VPFEVEAHALREFANPRGLGPQIRIVEHLFNGSKLVGPLHKFLARQRSGLLAVFRAASPRSAVSATGVPDAAFLAGRPREAIQAAFRRLAALILRSIVPYWLLGRIAVLRGALPVAALAPIARLLATLALASVGCLPLPLPLPLLPASALLLASALALPLALLRLRPLLRSLRTLLALPLFSRLVSFSGLAWLRSWLSPALAALSIARFGASFRIVAR